jgi:hypothetical protein
LLYGDCLAVNLVHDVVYEFARKVLDWGVGIWDRTDIGKASENISSPERISEYRSCRACEPRAAVLRAKKGPL